MAERIVSWKAIADFATVSREAKKTERSLDSLQRKQQSVNTESKAATAAAIPAQTQLARAVQNTATVTDKATGAVTRNTTAQQRQVAAVRQVDQANKSAAVSSNAAADASERHARSSGVVSRGFAAIATAARSASSAVRDHERSTASATRTHDIYGRKIRQSATDHHLLGRAASSASKGVRELGGAFGIVAGAAKLLILPVITNAVQALSAAIGPLTSGLLGLAGAIGPVSGLLATLPGLLAAAGGGVATVMLGFAGLGAALKAHGKVEQAQTKATQQRGAAQKKAAADTQASARAIQSAQRGVASAEDNLKEAHKGVTQARIAARQEIENLRKSLKALKLEEESASLGLEDAKERLAHVMVDPGSTDLERRQAALAVKQAESSLDGVKDSQKQNAKDLKDAQRKGVEGSDQVVAAKKAEKDATQSLADAQQSLNDAHQKSVDRTAAAAAGSTAAAAATNEYAAAMAKLTPEARAVVEQLLKMKPLLDKIRATAQKGMMPGVLSFLKDAVKLFDPLNGFVGKAATAFGDFFERIGNGLTAKGGLAKLKSLLESTNKIITIGLDAFYNLGRIIGNVAVAAIPLTEWLATTIDGWTLFWANATGSKSGAAAMKAYFSPTGPVVRTLTVLGGIIKNLATILFDLGSATKDTGYWILDSFKTMTDGWVKFTHSVEGQKVIQDWATQSRPVLEQIAKLFGALLTAFINIGKDQNLAGLLAQIREQLLPAIERVVGSLSGDFLPKLVTLATNLANVVAALANTGVLKLFADGLVTISNALALIAGNKVGAEVLAGLVITIGGLMVAAKVVSGVVALGQAIGLVVEFAAPAAAALAGLAGAAALVAIPFAVIAGFFAVIIGHAVNYKKGVDDLTQSFIDNNGVLGDNLRLQREKELADSKAIENGRLLGLSEAQVRDSANASSDAVQKRVQEIRNSTTATAEEKHAAEELMKVITGQANSYRDAYTAAKPTIDQKRKDGEYTKELGKETETTADAQARAAEEARRQAAAEATATAEIDKQTQADQRRVDAINATHDALNGLRGGYRGYQAAVDDAQKSVKENGRTLNINTEKGRANQEALDRVATSAKDVAQGMKDADKSQGEINKTLANSKKQFVTLANSMGMSTPVAKALFDQLTAMPKKVTPELEVVKAAKATNDVDAFWKMIKKLPKDVQTQLGAIDHTKEGMEEAKKKLENYKQLKVDAKAGVKSSFSDKDAAKLKKEMQGQLDHAVTTGDSSKLPGGVNYGMGAGAKAEKTTPLDVKSSVTVVTDQAANTKTMQGVNTTVTSGLTKTNTWVTAHWTNTLNAQLMKPIKTLPAQIGKVLSDVRDKTAEWVAKIATAFDGLKKAAANPVSFIIDTVINDGLIAAYNAVASQLGLGSLSKVAKPKGLADGGPVGRGGRALPSAYADGGRIRGGPGRGHGTSDSILGVNARGVPTSRVSAGEYVVPEKPTKKYFPLLERMRHGLSPYRRGGLNESDDKRRSRKYKYTDDALIPLKAGGVATSALPTSVPGMPGNIQLIAQQGPDEGDEGFGSPASKGNSMVGQMGWYRRCLAFVNACWNHKVARFGKATARDSMNAGPRTMKGTPPAGAGVYWDTGWAGHIALAMGDGDVVSNDIVKAGRLDRVRQGVIDKWGPYKGWWHPGGAVGGPGEPSAGVAAAVVDYVAKFVAGAKDAVAAMSDPSLATPFGGLASATARKLYDGMLSVVQKAQKKLEADSTGGVSTAGVSGTNQEIGHQLMLRAGFGENQWSSLKKLWTRESGWRTTASNPSSGAYGIPQSLPGSKMASAGGDWKTNPATQIKWGLGYIKGRYGDPNGAWGHSQKTGWYARGTNSARRGPAVVGENGPELIYMHGGEKVVSNEVSGLPSYSTGGVVHGFQPGKSGDWVRALQRATKQKKITGKWNSGLTAALSKKDGLIPIPTFPPRIIKKKGKKDRKVSTVPKDWAKWVKDLELMLGLGRDGKWGAEVTAPLKHILAHALGWVIPKGKTAGPHGHRLYDVRGTTGPKAVGAWAPLTAGEKAIKEQERSNQLNAEFDGLVNLFQSWGLLSLVRKMKDLGTADGLIVARSLRGKPGNKKVTNEAKAYDAAMAKDYARSDAVAGGDSKQAKFNQLVAALNAGTAAAPVGLQGAAKAISSSLDATAELYDLFKGQAGYKNLAANKKSRFEKDILAFKKLFVFSAAVPPGMVKAFARGGSIPGSGRGDKVPLLGEPGEFMVRRAAVEALTRAYGPNVMGTLNNADRLANGGFVAGGIGNAAFAPGQVNVTRRRTSKGLGGGHSQVNNFYTTVNNPTLEDGAVSVQKRVTRVAQLGLLNAGDR